MTADQDTMRAYAAKTQDYLSMVSRDKPDGDIRAFMEALPDSARVLDLGCGPGNSAAMMRDAGFEVEAWDASPDMVAAAAQTFGLEAKVKSFDDLTNVASFDGIWANFSLLHARKSDMPRYLMACARALRPGGLFHLGGKLGEGERRDALGRFYAYYSRDELVELLADAGFHVRAERQGETESLAGGHEPFIILLSDLPSDA